MLTSQGLFRAVGGLHFYQPLQFSDRRKKNPHFHFCSISSTYSVARILYVDINYYKVPWYLTPLCNCMLFVQWILTISSLENECFADIHLILPLLWMAGRLYSVGERSLSLLSELLAQINAMSLSQFVSHRCPGAGVCTGQQAHLRCSVSLLGWLLSCLFQDFGCFKCQPMSESIYLKYKNYELSMKAFFHCMGFKEKKFVFYGLHSINFQTWIFLLIPQLSHCDCMCYWECIRQRIWST